VLKVTLIELEGQQDVGKLLDRGLVLVGGGHSVLINQVQNALDEHVLQVETSHALLEVSEANLPEGKSACPCAALLCQMSPLQVDEDVADGLHAFAEVDPEVDEDIHKLLSITTDLSTCINLH